MKAEVVGFPLGTNKVVGLEGRGTGGFLSYGDCPKATDINFGLERRFSTN